MFCFAADISVSCSAAIISAYKGLSCIKHELHHQALHAELLAKGAHCYMQALASSFLSAFACPHYLTLESF